MHVTRIGFTPVKGARHQSHDVVRLAPAGPVGDRVFCLVDPVADRCLRTVENPTMVRTVASWDGVELSVDLPSGRVADGPVLTGEPWSVDYWGRTAVVQRVDGPWAAAYSAHLDRDVVLAATAPGEVVYGAPVSVVTSGSLAQLGAVLGARVDAARFRATVTLDTGDRPPFEGDGWIGRRLRIGSAEVELRGPIPRCAVVDLDPETGERDLGVMKALPRLPRRVGGVTFGVDAVVTAAGSVHRGDEAALLP